MPMSQALEGTADRPKTDEDRGWASCGVENRGGRRLVAAGVWTPYGGRLDKGKKTEQGPPLHQSVLFADGSRPGGVSAASAHSTHGCELAGPSPSTTPEVPQIRVIPAYDSAHLIPPTNGDLVPASPDYLNYVWTLAIFDGGYPFNGKTEEQNSHIRVLSEVYRGTDVALDRVLELLNKTRICPSDSITKSIDRLLADLTVNISAIQYKLVLELASIVSTDECHTFCNREVDRHVREAKKCLGSGQDTPATAGSTVGEKHPDVEEEEKTPDPWSQEPLEFTADDGYSKKCDASFSKTTKFLSETTSFAASAFCWRTFLDSAAWNKADHALHNAVNMTTPIPPATFHPVVVDSMLRLYLTGRAPVPLAHPLYQYACYDCCYFGHWSCHNGRGSRWTPTSNLSAKDENEGPRCSTTHSVRTRRHRSPTPGPSVNPGQSGVR
ncbi:hypothetical protein PISMIDRAFT_11395 [Pisolithus microcarpus 441]|uniref:Uncharacterized protein n=1 Tax=Pisolithus microcarpus 441 TaxID=765257 RepID=A0A0C9ZSW2_9AGAM|nr:hypothetical protein PISMIDRAFT_11395 [Pisolithus microcarpus 441]